jgi:hypothetical protein
MAPSSNHSDASSNDGFSVAPTSASQIQGISIRHHVPVTLNMDEGNYGQWHLFFDSTLSKFRLEGHVRSPTLSDERDRKWRMVDSCIVNWILATVSKGVFDVIRRDHHDAFSLWHAVEGLFQDNELQRTVYLEAEPRSLQQGDMSMNDYCIKLKCIADRLHDIGHPVSEPSQVLNLLRGLNPQYCYVKSVITSKYPPHNFMSVRSFLILEELSFQHDANAEAGQALTATHGDHSARLLQLGLHRRQGRVLRLQRPKPQQPIRQQRRQLPLRSRDAARATAAVLHAPTPMPPTISLHHGPRATTHGKA